ncbi:ATP-dependent helicase HrpB [Geotalea uraniireducens]|uniref:ATP-dependent helicase HrpB n=2 Tax=Geotalea uraniireducens TaxID=351604 RepID=A0ABM8EN33_9BACT|nr:ATP-dependent helicase HrpB [Geotalea uraniireducens]
MLEPRRLAASNAARWMAATLGEEVGATVGYAIRFERTVSARTRIEVVTEGILTRRLQADPFLEDVGVVIFDEFHERSIHADLALALCRDVQRSVRDDLRILVMSATLAAEPVARLLDAPILVSEGRSFPVVTHYLAPPPREQLAESVARAVLRAYGETDGDILAFLPGAGEIRHCQRLLAAGGGKRGPLLVVPLYGDLPFAAQERAIAPAAERKVVLATNIAETSLTIEGVRVVVDGGYGRRLRFDPATGLNRLVTERISAASAVQRTGRAGRLGPGSCYRLWSEPVQQTLIPYDPPEICRSDLASLALELAAWGVTDAAALAWVDQPPAAALEEGRQLLRTLGALDTEGRITAAGRAMSVLPVHPRLAHLLLAAGRRGEEWLACDIAALLSERDILRFSAAEMAVRHESDLLARLEALQSWRRGDRGMPGIDGHGCRIVDRTATQLRRLLGVNSSAPSGLPAAADVSVLLAQAYPDRVALCREQGTRRYLLAGGRGARLGEQSAVHDEPLLVAYVLERGVGGEDLIRQASALPETLFRREFAGELVRRREVAWDERERKVVVREEERYGSLVLRSRPCRATDDELRAALLDGLARQQGLDFLNWTTRARQFVERVRFLADLCPDDGWPDFSAARLIATLAEWLGPYLGKARSSADVAAIDPLPAVQALLSWEQLRRLDEGAPTHLTVPSGSRIPLEYGGGAGPTLAVKLQEMFGLAETPSVAWGRVPVVVHLLSPAGRPLQVTADLRGFWDGAYREVKKEMKGRYPKHPWPDDPWLAVPTRRTKRSGEH